MWSRLVLLRCYYDSIVEDWKTSRPDECICQVSYVYNRHVSFQVRSVCVDGLLGVEFWYLTKIGWQVLPDKMVTI